MVTYHGNVALDGFLTGETSRVGVLSGSISIARSELSPESVYKGEYELIPDPVKSQELPTRNLFLKENVKLAKIPYFETDNLEGGKTIIIGDKDYA